MNKGISSYFVQQLIRLNSLTCLLLIHHLKTFMGTIKFSEMVISKCYYVKKNKKKKVWIWMEFQNMAQLNELFTLRLHYYVFF